MLFLVGVTILIFSTLNLWIWNRDFKKATDEDMYIKNKVNIRRYFIWGIIGLFIVIFTQLMLNFIK